VGAGSEGAAGEGRGFGIGTATLVPALPLATGATGVSTGAAVLRSSSVAASGTEAPPQPEEALRAKTSRTPLTPLMLDF